ncbi:TPA: helix-turn-helix transcriptional regulator [Escherichia coli]|nr:helix-turn-helix transcriptional regulator [Escherichia coli]HAW4140537.1 helix-turn-helix transcriptional regulator [Escherichia coli]
MNKQSVLNSLNSLNSLNFAIKENEHYSNTLFLKRIRFYNCAIIYIRNARLLITTSDGKIINVHPESICYIEKNTIVDVSLNVLGEGNAYDIFHIESDMLNCVCKVMEPFSPRPQKIDDSRNKIFTCQLDEVDTKIFNRLIKQNTHKHRLVYKIVYLLSKFNNIESLIYSLSVSTDVTFTEKVKMIIENNLSKQWRLQDLANMLHMSEVSIRKKLERENNNFNSLVLDIRMHNAAKIITTTEKHINSIADEVGYMSTSYFIRVFKNYFGITPKQLAIKIKRKA